MAPTTCLTPRALLAAAYLLLAFCSPAPALAQSTSFGDATMEAAWSMQAGKFDGVSFDANLEMEKEGSELDPGLLAPALKGEREGQGKDLDDDTINGLAHMSILGFGLLGLGSFIKNPTMRAIGAFAIMLGFFALVLI